MFGEKCLELIKEESRETVELIMPYNKALVDEVIREIIVIHKILFRFVLVFPVFFALIV